MISTSRIVKNTFFLYFWQMLIVGVFSFSKWERSLATYAISFVVTLALVVFVGLKKEEFRVLSKLIKARLS